MSTAPAAKGKGGSALAKLSTAGKVGVGATMFVLVGVAYFVMGYSEISSKIASRGREEAMLQGELTTARAGESAYLKDLAELTDKQQRQRDMNKVLPETAETPSFLSALQGVANVSGVSLNSWEPMDEVTQQFFAKVPMKLQLSGRFHQIAKFIDGVAQLDRIINLENITLRDPKRDGDDVVLTVESLATTFHTLQPKPAAAPGAK